MAKSAARERAKGGAALISKEQSIEDYQTAYISRQASLLARKEVLTGKAKFGIFGDGKEVAQTALARSFRHGDWRSGYYRDQTFMFAIGASDVRKFFAQLYADTDLTNEPASGGRQMNAHFASRYIDQDGRWLNQLMMHNVSSDNSPTACQMARLLGLGYASKLYRNIAGLADNAQFSVNGNEVAFGTIGNASTSEGVFWEALNAAGVLQTPIVMSVWDDDYGISVPAKYQTTKESISKICEGFRKGSEATGWEIFAVNGWDYPSLVETYRKATELARKTHTPVLVHVQQLTQPQGHSTSGSHERYKSKERLEYEAQMDCLVKMRSWLIDVGHMSEVELSALEDDAQAQVRTWQTEAWQAYMEPIESERAQASSLLADLASENPELTRLAGALGSTPSLNRKLIASTVRRALLLTAGTEGAARRNLSKWNELYAFDNQRRYSAHLMAEREASPLRVRPVPAEYDPSPELVDGRQIIQMAFKERLEADPRVFIIGEDVGGLGGVNLEFDGLADLFGEDRVTDTGIREATILGQGIGAAMRGLRPVVDIQYLDYLLYCFQVLSDDLATLHYRSAAGQAAPVIVRTKGHRLEGIWHTGSPMGMILGGVRGLHVCVPRNMTQAVGMYNTLFEGDDPALVIEVLNGYRLKEPVPRNLSDFRVPLGKVQCLREGHHVTLVTYGACVRVAEEAAGFVERLGISIELIDAQTLLPFDLGHDIAASLRKTASLVVLDEDVPGGASAYILREVLEVQSGYELLDAPPVTITARAHRSAYGSDGDYYSKPSAEDVVEAVVALMHERLPYEFPGL